MTRFHDLISWLVFDDASQRRTAINAALEWGEIPIRRTGLLIAAHCFVVVSGDGINPASTQLMQSTGINEEQA